MRLTEKFLSVIFVISLAAQLFAPQNIYAAVGVSKKLSYQGRLTDASNNPLGGSGTTYCFRFGIYDAVSAGTKLWPAGTPTSNSLNVVNGVFNTAIGDADTLTYDFSLNDTVYLNIEVNVTPTTCSGAWENLSPRQRIDATAYARVAESVYGGQVRVGTGAGAVAGSQKLLILDVVNSSETLGAACSQNGALWYNSANTRALLCENGTIKPIGKLDALGIGGNTAGTPTTITNGTFSLAGGNNVTLSQNGSTITISAFNQSTQTQNLHNVTLSGNTAGVMAQISSGTMTLAGGNNITLSQNGNAITISGAAGGGAGVNTFGMSNLGNTAGTSGTINGSAAQLVFAGGPNITLSQSINGSSATISISAGAGGGGGGAAPLYLFENNLRQSISNVTNITAISERPIFIPFYVPGDLTASRIMLEMSRATSGSNLFTIDAGIYTFANSTSMNLLGSVRNTFSNTATASISGIRMFHVTGLPAGISTLAPGNYVMALKFSAGNTASMNYSLRGGITAGPPVGQILPGANTYNTATSLGIFPFFGRYSANSAALPSAVAQSQVIGNFSGASTPVGAWFGIRAN